MAMTDEAMSRAKARFQPEASTASSDGPSFDMDAYLTRYGIRFQKQTNGDSTKFVLLDGCPFNESHKGKDAAVFVLADGTLGFKCFHDGCSDLHWKEFRQVTSGDDDLSAFRSGGKKTTEAKPKDKQIDPMEYLQTGAQLQAMDVHVNWLVEDLIPENSITLVIGPAGYGKSTLCLNIANAVDRGFTSWLGRTITKRPASVLDYENPLAVDVERSRALDLAGILFWHTSAEVPPPRIDSPEYEAIKKLPSGLIIVDSHRASQMGDENSSQDTALVMERWKEIRAIPGNTLLIICHTQKANEQVFRGSQALIDQADHVLYFYPVRKPGSDDPVESEDPDSMTYFLGTKDKTRFKACRIYLKRAGEGRFTIAGNPDDEKIELLAGIIEARGEVKQTDIIEAAKEELGLGKTVTLRLLKRGEERGAWVVKKGNNNSSLYQFTGYSPPKEGEKTGKPDSDSFHGDQKPGNDSATKSVGTLDFSGLPDGAKNNRKTDIKNDPRYLDAVCMYLRTMSQAEAEKKAEELFRTAGWI